MDDWGLANQPLQCSSMRLLMHEDLLDASTIHAWQTSISKVLLRELCQTAGVEVDLDEFKIQRKDQDVRV